MAEYWFEPKSHGYGAAPSTWQGWALTLAFVAVSVVLVFAFLVRPVLHDRVPGVASIAAYAASMAITTLVFIHVCRRKTRGEWRWRWGGGGS